MIVLFRIARYRFIVAMAAKRLVYILFAEHYQLVRCRQSVGMVCWTSAFHANCMYFLNLFSNCH